LGDRDRGDAKIKDRNLLLTNEGLGPSEAQNPAVVCFTSLLSSLTAISPPPLFTFESTTQNLLLFVVVSSTSTTTQPRQITLSDMRKGFRRYQGKVTSKRDLAVLRPLFLIGYF